MVTMETQPSRHHRVPRQPLFRFRQVTTSRDSEIRPWSPLRWIGRAALRLDDFLRRGHRVIEYCSDPRCVFRMQMDQAGEDFVFADGTPVCRDENVINLHLWNEHVPVIPPDGPTVAWGRRMGSSMNFSMRQLAAFIASRSEFDRVTAVRFKTAVATASRTRQLLRIMEHFGFEIVPDRPAASWRQKVHEFGENILALLLLTAVNPESARLSVLWRVRSQVLLSRKNFDRRYGTRGAANAAPDLVQNSGAEQDSETARCESPRVRQRSSSRA